MHALRTAAIDEHTNAATGEPDGSRRGAPHIVADYELQGRLTRYPAADSFLAIHQPSGGERVLYVLRPAAMQDRPLVHRAACEVDAVRWIRHPSVPTVDPCGETSQGRLYIAVERRAGQTLDELVAGAGPLDVENLVRIAGRLVEALDQAHALGLVHAGLTPASVLLGLPDGAGRRSVSLLGLGTSAATAHPIAVDELAYTSPEQVGGGTPDARSDVFAFASVLQFALDGVPPLPELARRALRETRAAARGADTTTVAGVIAVARSADPASRYASVKSFWDELLAALVREGREPAVERAAAPVPPAPALAVVEASPRAREIEAATEGVFDAPAWEGACPPVAAIPVRRVAAWRWAAVGLTAVGLAGAAGLAGAGGWASTSKRTTVADAGVVTAPAPRAVVASPSVGRALGAVAAPAAKGASVATASDQGTEGASRAAVKAPKMPRLADIAMPEIKVAPSQPAQRELVGAAEFAALADASRARDRGDTVRPAANTAATISAAAARSEATRAVDAFASALAARDLAALRRAAPDMPATERARWEKVFREARSVAAHLTVLDVQVDGGSITAKVRSRIDVRMPDTSVPTRFDAVSVATLVHDSAGWRLWAAP